MLQHRHVCRQPISWWICNSTILALRLCWFTWFVVTGISCWKNMQCLTLWELLDEYVVPGIQPKTSSFQLLYQRHSSSADCARELFKGSNGSDSLLVCNGKNFFGWELWIFCEWHHKWSSFWVILAHVAWPRVQLLGESISLKFSLETRLESESFEPWINFLGFLVQKLWSKINQVISLTLWKPGYDIFVLWNRPKTSSFSVALPTP